MGAAHPTLDFGLATIRGTYPGVMKGAKTVDEYVAKCEAFGDVVARLREVLNGTPLEEGIKWGAPSYGYAGKNVVGIAAFKEHCALWFHQGALLEDAAGHFEDPAAVGSSAKAMRQWRFHSVKEVKARAIKAYVKEAMALVDDGKEIKPERGKAIEIPPELAALLAKRAKLRKAFDALSPGKRREYADHVAEAKRADTKERRLEKIAPMIEAGVGLHDRYRKG